MKIVIVVLYFIIRLVVLYIDITRYSKYDSFIPLLFWMVFFSQYGIFAAFFMVFDSIISIKHCISDESTKYVKVTSILTLTEIAFVWMPSFYSAISSWNSSAGVIFLSTRIICPPPFL